MKRLILLILSLGFILILCSFHVRTYDEYDVEENFSDAPNSTETVSNIVPLLVSVKSKQTPTMNPIVEEIVYEFDPDADYVALMIEAAVSGDITLGNEYERLHKLQSAHFGINNPLNFDDLYLLAKIVEVEAGSSWITDEHKQMVASVVVNRVNSPEFPDTMYDVVYQRRQYAAAGTKYFEELIPSESSVRNALYVLQNGSIAPETVVFQAEFKQGSSVYKTYNPEKLGTTYFCHSSYPELYADHE